MSINQYELDNTKIRDIVFKMTDVVVRQWIYDSSLPMMFADIWISEGIITYLKYIGIENALPRKLNMTDEFVIVFMHNTLAIDILPNKYKLIDYKTNYTIKNNKFLENHSNIYVEKSAAIIRMLSHMLKEKVFIERLISILKK